MKISATVLADSLNEDGIRITTLELHYHRYILPELNTHRVISKNGASSRAIPTEKLIDMCEREMVEPLEWGLNQSGMQAFNIADFKLEHEGRVIWNAARRDAIRHALALNALGFAKQIVNRVLEPFLSTRTVVTSTDWANFMALRDHKDAQPEIRELARCIKIAMNRSIPKILAEGEWHTPYILPEDEDRIALWAEDGCFTGLIRDLLEPKAEDWIIDNVTLVKLMVSAARCARVSVRTADGKAGDFRKDLELFQRLVKAQPVHASPTEHQAAPYSIEKAPITANFRGFVPFRRMIIGETVHD